MRTLGSLLCAWHRWGHKGEEWLQQGVLQLETRGRHDHRKRTAPGILQIWFFIRKAISQLCKYAVILCIFFLISLSNCTRGSIAVMKSICHSLPADCNLHLHCSLSYRCMGNMEWRNLVCWISNFYRENRVQGVQGGLWPIVPSAQRLAYLRTVRDWTHDRASPPSKV